MQNGNSITKADLKAALSELRTEMQADLKAGLVELRTEFKADLQAQDERLMQEMRQIETNLLTEFHRYGKGQQLRLHSLETRDAAYTERLAVIEERLLHLETRRPPSV